jgi:hypothetical protein
MGFAGADAPAAQLNAEAAGLPVQVRLHILALRVSSGLDVAFALPFAPATHPSRINMRQS